MLTVFKFKPCGNGVYYYIPHVLRFFDQPRMVASLAPRALLVAHSQNDRYVSPASVLEMEAYAWQFYEKLGAGFKPDESIFVYGQSLTEFPYKYRAFTTIRWK